MRELGLALTSVNGGDGEPPDTTFTQENAQSPSSRNRSVSHNTVEKTDVLVCRMQACGLICKNLQIRKALHTAVFSSVLQHVSDSVSGSCGFAPARDYFLFGLPWGTGGRGDSARTPWTY